MDARHAASGRAAAESAPDVGTDAAARRGRRPPGRLSVVAVVLAALALVAAGDCRLPLSATRPAGDSAAAAESPRRANPAASPRAPLPRAARLDPLLETLEARTFQWFWDTADPATGLVPDRWPTRNFSSVAAIGFGLASYTIGAERGYVTRAAAAARTRATLEYLLNLPQGPQSTGVAGYKGFFYHFLKFSDGTRFASDVELSTIDTALLVAGALAAKEYFDGAAADERAIGVAADALYGRVEWGWARPRPPLISMGWTPENGFHPLDWKGYNEGMILYILALGSPTHAIAGDAWTTYTATYDWAPFQGYEMVNFGPLFGHQYSHVFVDFRGIRDGYMQGKGIDYFENSRRAVYSQRAYAIANPGNFKGYGADLWGLTACDGPNDGAHPDVDGNVRSFMTYGARAAAANELRDDGTIAPTAAAGSLPFAPEIVLPALRSMVRRGTAGAFTRYGFVDAFNLTYGPADPPAMGRYVAGVGWFGTDYLGIDQGPIVAMIENHRSGLLWSLCRRDAYIVTGLRRAGFSGGWLDAAP